MAASKQLEKLQKAGLIQLASAEDMLNGIDTPMSWPIPTPKATTECDDSLISTPFASDNFNDVNEDSFIAQNNSQTVSTDELSQ